MELIECYKVLLTEGATRSQEDFSRNWCEMNPGYLRSQVQRPALEVLVRIRDRLDRLAASRRNPQLRHLREEIAASINERVGIE